ncbi:FAD dependent oxidoreductase [Metallosphaera sedula]|uniref:FAD dependent oxidoreductase n=3 Tax=Metallosphaera TaxID=41980 RepID=A4YGG9_METS5|nr:MULTISPECIES: NAD(P)/FAD-dependent oxidoreductase [Metallosphaera]ABP95521.1 FAD dependent oxidoreductase [Metallosphaera sedula DSM 5348]AIM27505.1 FAD dependent oxidoreductase [Metallosphaera sedula]AKV74374.1 FAD-dependent oxidoreductase [Metallosphaera sedula]AKV76613.1 FAD-dependent oxidoreductase [Metallosphaera sedula]AKV78865.1 FAD-dependent oxidoreductase [Metallosphaera sedula]
MKALVIGAGHNGLIASYYLRKLGLDVTVLEASHRIGGMTESAVEAKAVISRASYVLGIMPESLRREFEIPIIESEIFQTIEYDGELIPFYREPRRRREVLGKYFPKFSEFEDKLFKMKEIMSWFTFTSSPPSREKILEVAEREGVPEMVKDTSAHFLKEYLPREVHRYFIYPSMEDAPAYMVAYFYNEWSLVPSGMGTIPSLIEKKARSLGVEIKTRSKVDQIVIRNGKVTGVKVGDRELKADLVVSAISPVATFSMTEPLMDLKLDPGKGGWVKYNVVFRDGVKVRDDLKPYLQGIIDLEVGEIIMPSVLDETRGAPVLEFMGDREEVLSMFSGEILYEEKITADYALRYYHAPGGNLNHLPMRYPYLFDGRPVKGWGYRTPVKGLYLSGAGTYPGGQVTGIPGYNVALAVEEDLQQGF